jgi:CBS domain-containing protein
MNVSELMTHDPITLRPDDVVSLALEHMHRYDVRELPVVVDDTLVGIVTDRDVRMTLGLGAVALDERELSPRSLAGSIEAIMTSDVATLHPAVPASEACRLLVAHKVGAMPVVDAQGGLLGICSVTDLLSEAAVLFEQEE